VEKGRRLRGNGTDLTTPVTLNGKVRAERSEGVDRDCREKKAEEGVSDGFFEGEGEGEW
jgi:hypothetical protein